MTQREWIQKSTGLLSIRRISGKLAPSSTILYALMEVNTIARIYKSTNYGASWNLSYSGAESFFNGQGWFDNFIEVHPTNPDIVLAGGIDVFRTSNGGASWSNTTNGYSGGNVHVDQHAPVFISKIQILFFCVRLCMYLIMLEQLGVILTMVWKLLSFMLWLLMKVKAM